MVALADQEEATIVGRAYDARLVKRLLTYLIPYRGALAGSGTLLILASVVEVIRPYLLKVAIDSYIVPAELQGLWGLALLYLGILALEGAVRYGLLFVTQWTGQRIMVDLRLEVFAHLNRLSLRYFDSNPAGRIFTRVTSDVENVKELFTSGLVSAGGDLLTAGAIVAAMLYLDLKLSLITFAILPLLIAVVVLFQEKARGTYRLIRQKLSRLNAFLQESLNGMGVIQSFGREAVMATRFARLNAEHREATLRSLLYYALFYPAVEVTAATSCISKLLEVGQTDASLVRHQHAEVADTPAAASSFRPRVIAVRRPRRFLVRLVFLVGSSDLKPPLQQRLDHHPAEP